MKKILLAIIYISAIANINNLFAQAPVLSYSSPQAYTTGTAIPSLSPVNTGGAIPSIVTAQVTTFAGSGATGSANGTGTAASFNYPAGVTRDASGNLYIADQGNNLIRKITPAGVVSVFAGSGAQGAANGSGTAASFYYPQGLAIDAAGNIYVADIFNNLIRKITSAGVVSTLAGTGSAGSANGTGTAASFDGPDDVAVDASGNVYVADEGNNLIRKISPAGVVTTLAGSGATGAVNGTGTAASFNEPNGVAVDANGNVYVADQNNNMIRKITPAGLVSTLAGNGTAGATNGTATAATFNSPVGVTTDTNGNVYVADSQNYLIRKITSAGLVTTVAGTGVFGATNGAGTVATFGDAYGIVADNSNNLYIADNDNNLVRKIALTGYTITPALPAGLVFNSTTGVITGTPTVVSAATTYTIVGSNAVGSGTTTLNITVKAVQAPKITYTTPQVYTAGVAITPLSPVNTGGTVPVASYGFANTLAGSGTAGTANGTGTAASFNIPSGVAIDAAGNIYVADNAGNDIRKITTTGVVTTFAGSGTAGSANGTGTAASFSFPCGLAVDASGNVYVADYNNNMVRKITPAGVVTTVASNLSFPADVALDASGNIYVAEGGGTTIDKITAAGVVSIFASGLQSPFGVAVSSTGTVYASDFSMRIFKISPAGVVTVLAGSGATGSANGTGTAASFNNPNCLKVDAAGFVYVGDTGNNLVRKISPTGVVTTIAGSGLAATTNGTGTAASFNGPYGLALDAANNIYVSEQLGNVIRKILNTGYGVSPALPKGISLSNVGVISGTPVGGSPATTYIVTAYNSSGGGAAVVNITVNGPPVITYAGPQVYTTGKAIAALSPVSTGGVIIPGLHGATTTFAGSGTAGSANGTSTAASFNIPFGLVSDASGNIYVADQHNNLIRKITSAGVVSTFAGSGTAGSANGTGTAASFNTPCGLTIDASGNVYVADFGNALVRMITPAGVVSTVPGTFTNPIDVAIDASGNIYTADKVNNLVQKLTPGGSVTSFGSGFNQPDGISVDAAGNVYVADFSNRILKLTPAGVVSVVAGSGTAGALNGTGAAASFSSPGSLKVDGSGNVFVADNGNNLIREITPTGVVNTLAGSGVSGSLNGTGIAATFNSPHGIAIDPSDNIYVSGQDNLVRKVINPGYGITPTLPKGLAFNSVGVITGIPTVAGTAKTYFITAYNTSGRSTATIVITVNGAPAISYAGPQTYATGTTIAPLSPANTGGAVPAGTFGLVNAFAGSTTSGSVNGTGSGASFNGPLGIATDAAGNVYAVDENNNLIRKITPAGVVTTFAGSGTQGSSNGTGIAASFKHPTGLGIDQYGNVFVADQGNNLVRKITAAGVVTTFAGSGTAGATNGTGIAASFNQPTSIAIDAFNDIYVTDYANNSIRRITQSGAVTTFAGSGAAGSVNGTGAAASFHGPTGITVDENSNVYVTDQLNHEIRKITSAGVVTTLAGNGTAGSANGAGTTAGFNNPYAITVDGSGNLYVADYNNNEIRMITAAGLVTTLAGTTTAGSANGTGLAASFNHPAGIALDGNGNLYEADYFNNEIRTINVTGFTITPALPGGLAFDGTTGTISGTPNAVSAVTTYSVAAFNGSGNSTAVIKITVNAGIVTQAPVITYTGPNTYTEGTAISSLSPGNSGGSVPSNPEQVVTTVAGNGTAGSANGTGTLATFNIGQGAVTVGLNGITYVADRVNNLVREISATGVVSTLAGNGTAGSANGTGTAASFNGPDGVCTDYNGNVYVADSGNNLVRMITSAGVVTTLAGSGIAGNTDGTGTSASFSGPSGMAYDYFVNGFYVVDTNNEKIRLVTTAGVVTTVASDNSLLSAHNITFDPSANIYYSASDNYIRKVSSGVITVFAGNGTKGAVNGTGTVATFNNPAGIGSDASGNLYVADEGNNLIRFITPAGLVSVFAGTGSVGSANSTVTSSSFNSPVGLAVNWFPAYLPQALSVYIADSGSNLIRKTVNVGGYAVSPALPGGLTFNNSTGVFSGTPSAVEGPTTYTVTTSNPGGAASANVSIGVLNSVNHVTVPNIYTVGRANDPYGMARDASGNLYVASLNDNIVYRIDATTQAVTVFAGTGVAGYSGDGGPATSAQLNFYLPGLAVDASGNLYIGDGNNNRVRKVDVNTHVITTIAGTGVAGNSGAGGPATSAQLNGPGGITIDASNNIYIADENNSQILEVNATTQNISTVITGIGFVERMVLDGSGNMYFGDEGKYTINKYNLSTSSLSIIGGNGTFGDSGDGGAATSAQFEAPMSIAVDASGNVYIADQDTYTIRKINASNQTISTFAGTGADGYTGDGGSAILAKLGFLTDLLIDNNGFLYVGDNGNNAIRRIGGTQPASNVPNISYTGPQAYTAGTAITALSPANSGGAVPAQSYATVTTLAGSSSSGFVNGTGAAAKFNSLGAAAVDEIGNIYVAEPSGNDIRKISPSGVVTTFAGSGVAGSVNGTGTAASFNNPSAIVIDASGNLYVTDENNYEVRKISPAGVVTTLAGSGVAGSANGVGVAASFGGNLDGIAVDASGNVYVSDGNNEVIRKITSIGVVTTFAGSGSFGNVNGIGTAASFGVPGALTIDASGNLYLSDGFNNDIRKITPAGVVTSFGPQGTNFTGLAIDQFGYLYASGNFSIYRINPAGTSITLAGNNTNTITNGIGTQAGFGNPTGLAVDALGDLYVNDNYQVRKISLIGFGITPALPTGLAFAGTTGIISGTPTTVAPAATYTITAENASGISIAPLTISVDNPSATQAPAISYTGPQTYVAGTTISTLTPKNTGGAVPAAIYAQVSTLAGGGQTAGSANGTGSAASFNEPFGTATDASGNIYVADSQNQLIRKITPAGVVSTLAGSGVVGSTNGTGTAASFNGPVSLAVDASGNIYVSDVLNNLIRKISPSGVVTTFAGNGTSGSVNATGTAASFNRPWGLAFDVAGNLYVADQGNNLIREITPAGVVSTFAASASPTGLTVDKSGNVFVAESQNNLILKISSTGVGTTLAGSGTSGSADGTGTSASFYYPSGIVADGSGNLYVTDQLNNIIRKITSAGVVTTIAGNGSRAGIDGTGLYAYFDNPTGPSIDADGNLYIAQSGAEYSVRKINLTGYTISPALSKGLSFDGTTGIISGTAAAITPATAYAITAYNTAGISTAALTVTVNSATVKAPVISYAGPQTYSLNTAITPLTPTNTGGVLPGVATEDVSTYAGSGNTGAINATGTAASFSFGQGHMAIDASGNLYVADQANNIIRKITPAGVVSTLAGSGTAAYADGTGTGASFAFPVGITVDVSGNVYVGDSPHIRKITPDGVVTTLATISNIFGLTGLTSDAAGNVFAADADEGEVFKITPSGIVTTIVSDIHNDALTLLIGLTIDSSGNLYGACLSGVIIKITQSGVITTIAGNLNVSGFANGTGTAATFSGPYGITIDASGNLYVSDSRNNVIRKITAAGVVTTFAGNLSSGLVNSTTTSSYFSAPESLAIDVKGRIYVVDLFNNMIRKIGVSGYTISPALPAGLVINANTGVISGTPTVTSTATNYTVTAYNSGGTASTIVNIAVTSTGLARIEPKTYGAPDFAPVTTTTGNVSLTSSNATVATIISGKIHINGVGTSNITALINGVVQSQILKVLPAPLTIAVGNQFKTTGEENPRFTITYRGFVNGESEEVFTVLPSVITEVNAGSAPGEYNVIAGGAMANNYQIVYETGKITVKANIGNQVVKTGVADVNQLQGLSLKNEPIVKQAVSPNGDGVNDVLLIDNIINFPDNKLILMSRSGTTIFEAAHYDNVNHPFDGRSGLNGQMQQPGTYFYLLEYRDKGELKRKTGFFILKY